MGSVCLLFNEHDLCVSLHNPNVFFFDSVMHGVTEIQSHQRPLKPRITCLSRGMLNDCCRLVRGSGKVYPASSYFKLSLQ